MGRRSDHTRSELRALIIIEGHKHLAEVGFARFSAREVAKRIGYSIGTLYNVFGTLDALILAINTRTFGFWAAALAARLETSEPDRIRTLVEAYFAFARDNPNLWMAIYDHRLPPGMDMPAEDEAERTRLTTLVGAEIAAVLPAAAADMVPRLTRSLIATVHGHCSFALTGTFDLLGEPDPAASALARVRESLAANGAPPPSPPAGEGRLSDRRAG
jgi:AcrR family transcriptional regulator